jgi:4-amino-4-deoxy-L-arabinose transferase-like glycosyltransferase
MTSTEAAAPPAFPRLLSWLARRPRLWLTILCLALWVPGTLTLPALDRDESRYAQASRQMLESGNYVDIRFGAEPRYKKPIAVYWLQSFTSAVAGKAVNDRDHGQVWTYRIASLLGGLIGVWLTLWCAGAILPREGAFLAALLMGSSVLLTAESTIATTDAVQIGCVIGAMGVMWRVYRSRRDDAAPKPSMLLVMLGWVAFSAGILVKGFVVPGVASVTILALLVWDRKAGWLKALMPARGLLITILLVAPWLIAITLASKGAFFAESVGHDFGAKIVSGQETHGFPPGYYLLLSSIAFWPGILFVLPAVGAAVLRRGDPAIRFLLAWLGASWLMFEAVPTKLPHYVLPAYPALAILAAAWLCGLLAPPAAAPAAAPAEKKTDDKKEKDGEGEAAPAVSAEKPPLVPRLLRWAAGLQFLLGAGALTAAPVLLPRLYGEGDVKWLMYLAGGGAVVALTALILGLRGKNYWALTVAILAACVFVPTLTVGVGPRITQLWVSKRLAPLVSEHAQPGDPPPVAAGFTEPSLVFALGADTRLADGEGAAALGARDGGLALIEERERGAFLAGLAERQADATAVASMSGFNYSRGRKVSVTVYRVTKVGDAPR